MDKLKKGIRIGYHYTSYDNWQRIKKVGLMPYSINKENLNDVYFDNKTIQGIWIWQNKQEGLSHRGCILFQMATKSTTKAVLLKVKYDIDKALTQPGEPDRLIVLPHHGQIGTLIYHTMKNNEEGIVITESIPAEDISLVNTYDLLEVRND